MSGHGFPRVAPPHAGLRKALRVSLRLDASATLAVRPDPADVAVARRAVVGVVREWQVPLAPEQFGDLELLSAELITNAIRYSQATCAVVVRWNGTRVQVEVTDRQPVLPVPHVASPDAEAGRGLVLVEALAARWGTRLRPGGKAVWFEVATPRPEGCFLTAVTTASRRLARTRRSVRRSPVVLGQAQSKGAMR